MRLHVGNCTALSAFGLLFKGAETHAIDRDRAKRLSAIAQSVFAFSV